MFCGLNSHLSFEWVCLNSFFKLLILHIGKFWINLYVSLICYFITLSNSTYKCGQAMNHLFILSIYYLLSIYFISQVQSSLFYLYFQRGKVPLCLCQSVCVYVCSYICHIIIYSYIIGNLDCFQSLTIIVISAINCKLNKYSSVIRIYLNIYLFTSVLLYFYSYLILNLLGTYMNKLLENCLSLFLSS